MGCRQIRDAEAASVDEIDVDYDGIERPSTKRAACIVARTRRDDVTVAGELASRLLTSRHVAANDEKRHRFVDAPPDHRREIVR